MRILIPFSERKALPHPDLVVKHTALLQQTTADLSWCFLPAGAGRLIPSAALTLVRWYCSTRGVVDVVANESLTAHTDGNEHKPRLKMADSPAERNEDDVPATQSPENNETTQPQNDQNGDDNDMNPTRPEELGYDFEVKEQDRWLPIANGKFSP